MTYAPLAGLGILTTEDAPQPSADILRSTQERMGMVPNLYGEMAHAPGLLATYRFGYEEFRTGSGFSPAEQELLLLTISRFHECTYCVAVHSSLADRSRVPADVVDAVRDGRPVDDARLRALQELAVAVVQTRGRPAPEVLERFAAAGYTGAQVLQVILAVAVKTISNYTNHLFDTPLDPAFSGRAWNAPASSGAGAEEAGAA